MLQDTSYTVPMIDTCLSVGHTVAAKVQTQRRRVAIAAFLIGSMSLLGVDGYAQHSGTSVEFGAGYELLPPPSGAGVVRLDARTRVQLSEVFSLTWAFSPGLVWVSDKHVHFEFADTSDPDYFAGAYLDPNIPTRLGLHIDTTAYLDFLIGTARDWIVSVGLGYFLNSFAQLAVTPNLPDTMINPSTGAVVDASEMTFSFPVDAVPHALPQFKIRLSAPLVGRSRIDVQVGALNKHGSVATSIMVPIGKRSAIEQDR